jgi:hypothetical protein
MYLRRFSGPVGHIESFETIGRLLVPARVGGSRGIVVAKIADCGNQDMWAAATIKVSRIKVVVLPAAAEQQFLLCLRLVLRRLDRYVTQNVFSITRYDYVPSVSLGVAGLF